MRTGGNVADWKVVPLAAGGIEVFKSPEPDKIFLGNPSIVTLPGSRIVISLDLKGPGVKGLRGIKGKSPTSGHWLQGKVFVSTDKGATWTCKNDFPFHQAQLFRVESSIYLIGLAGDFKIMKSVDGGETWSKADDLMPADGEYTLTPGHVLQTKDYIHLALMKRVAGNKDDLTGTWVPVVLRGKTSDLMNRKSWSFSEPGKLLDDFIPRECLAFFGIKGAPVPEAVNQGGKPVPGRPAAKFEWDAPHVLDIRDGSHCWYDSTGRTLYLLATARVHRGNIAAMAKLVSDEGGRMTVETVSMPGGVPTALLTVPGGNLKFDVMYDDDTHLYWLVSNMASGSMQRTDKGAAPDDRLRVNLHFSRNLVDWCFACCVDAGLSTKELRHFCSMAVHGNDLYVVSCSGQTKPGNRSYTDRITFHAVPSFRELVY